MPCRVQSPVGVVIAHTDTAVALAADKSLHPEAMWRGQVVMDVVVPVWDGADLAEVDSTSLRHRDTHNRLATLRIGLSLDVAQDTALRICKEILWLVTIVNLLVLGASLFYSTQHAASCRTDGARDRSALQVDNSASGPRGEP